MPRQPAPRLGASSGDDTALARQYGTAENKRTVARAPGADVREVKEMVAPTPSKDGFFPPELMHLLATAQRVIDEHVNAYGTCDCCGSVWPCQRAQLAEFALTAL